MGMMKGSGQDNGDKGNSDIDLPPTSIAVHVCCECAAKRAGRSLVREEPGNWLGFVLDGRAQSNASLRLLSGAFQKDGWAEILIPNPG